MVWGACRPAPRERCAMVMPGHGQGRRPHGLRRDVLLVRSDLPEHPGHERQQRVEPGTMDRRSGHHMCDAQEVCSHAHHLR
jgi:hypothetical protein